MMETIRMQPAMPHQQQNHHLHQMVFRPPEPDIGNLLGMDMSGSGAVLTTSTCTPGPDFQLIDLNQTLDSILNNPNNAMCGRTTMPQNGMTFSEVHSQQYSNMGGAGDQVWFPAFPQIRPQQMTQSQAYQFDNGNAGYATTNKNSNKRLSVDFNGNITDYSGELWNTSPRSGTLEDPADANHLQMKASLSEGPVNLNITNGTKRQNVGPRPGIPPGHRLISAPQMNHMIPRGAMRHQLPLSPNQPNFQYLPQRPMYLASPGTGPPFYTLPRIPDLSNHPQPLNRANLNFIQQPRSHMAQVFGPRLPPPPAATNQIHQHQLQQQNFYFTGPMGPPVNAPTPNDSSQNEKKARFQRTAQILEQSGLMDCTLKTAALIRENSCLQREIDSLIAESSHLINQYLASGNSIQQPVFETQQMQQQNQQQQHQQRSMSMVIYPGGMA